MRRKRRTLEVMASDGFWTAWISCDGNPCLRQFLARASVRHDRCPRCQRDFSVVKKNRKIDLTHLKRCAILYCVNQYRSLNYEIISEKVLSNIFAISTFCRSCERARRGKNRQIYLQFLLFVDLSANCKSCGTLVKYICNFYFL